MAALLPLALLLPGCAWALAAPFPFPAGSRRSSCKPIPRGMALCHGVGYTEMRLPNLLGHDSMKEALQQASSWAPLLSKNCHGDAKKFLCSLFAPVCLSELGEPVSPCRALCEEVRDGCAPVMAAFGFPWPDMFNCSRFPQGDELCVPPAGPGDRPSLLKEDAVCTACVSFGQNEKEFLENFCSQDFALRMSIKALSYVDGDLKVIPELKSRTLYKQKGWSEEEQRQPVLWLMDGEACTCEELRGPSSVLLAMGHRVADRLVLSWVRRWQRGDKELKRLSRAVRKLQC
ncbi:PREDICTED: secreted frizzled-related protein 2-like isoform X1 [Crocodylus porosus]|nr:PREDICTED: secreted frizzled-related protein 2-like isoform X1 [Crocodylus porosus]XP_019386034.1 PREDICTED: secreted frizzled-related protein 2-like isoform X1 [Crocodylus porosus]